MKKRLYLGHINATNHTADEGIPVTLSIVKLKSHHLAAFCPKERNYLQYVKIPTYYMYC